MNNKKTYEYIAFDLDGTLYDAMPFLYNSYKEAIEELIVNYNIDIKNPTKDEILNEIGNPVGIIMENLFPNLSNEYTYKLGELIMDKILIYIENGSGILYDGVYDTIKKFASSNINLLLASNGRDLYIKSILNYYGLRKYFKNIISIDDKNFFNKSDILKSYISLYNINPETLLMVGDKSNDELAAQNVNCDFMWCIFGHGKNENIKYLKYKINHFNEILDLIL